ncbi:MAG: deoxyribose-phosphate aldolase [Candidatus Microthrix subdominans]|jgi:deoxyribose-phosphate aldolase|uniref:Deoxyribose-phosphate aldolase n=1 Tax=Candidatus Neomicrothrix subdominans TaxID=2954438 RepID=A0A936NG00_9ACTN|nr:deoxyribose-phosphate aldolase [Candidatus Microthrix sp.]MBK6439893.1 deoxyribose-phosphate aldolase [Candidatus Microthrix sp.]MBK9298944.1 deoxyribose-phosphate aldolase [Candidatus Microthrix subdominans]
MTSRDALAAIIDHTLLMPTASAGEVEALVTEAVDLGVGAVCVSPSRARLVTDLLIGAGEARPAVASVVGFPSGAHVVAIKAAEASVAVAAGASEVDVVADLAAVAGGDLEALAVETEAIRAAIGPGIVLKVILESAAILALGDRGSGLLTGACRTVADAGADLVKTSTGFHPAGGATTEAVALMAAAVAGRGSGSVGVKASGGIRSAADALAMVDAGATRIGASASRAILEDPVFA